jgi:hypothetical protein
MEASCENQSGGGAADLAAGRKAREGLGGLCKPAADNTREKRNGPPVKAGRGAWYG